VVFRAGTARVEQLGPEVGLPKKNLLNIFAKREFSVSGKHWG